MANLLPVDARGLLELPVDTARCERPRTWSRVARWTCVACAS